MGVIRQVGRSKPVLLGAVVLSLILAAFFMVFDVGVGSVSSQELPVVCIGQVDGTGGLCSEEQGRAPTTATTVPARGGTVSPPVSPSTSESSVSTPVSVLGTAEAPPDGDTETTTRKYVKELLRIQREWPTTTTTDDSGRGNGAWLDRSSRRRW